MKIIVLAEGKLKEKAYRELVDDYAGRLRKYAPFQEIEVREGSQLLPKVPEGALLVALEVQGEHLTSSELSTRVARWIERGKGIVVFAIGGAEGLPPALVERADARLSLSSFTLPHRLARLVLLEQLYRAFSILRGDPYARED